MFPEFPSKICTGHVVYWAVNHVLSKVKETSHFEALVTLHDPKGFTFPRYATSASAQGHLCWMVVLTAFLRHYPWPTALIASNIQLWLSHSPAGLGRHMVSQEYNISKLLEFEITCIYLYSVCNYVFFIFFRPLPSFTKPCIASSLVRWRCRPHSKPFQLLLMTLNG